jgi:lysophospholipase L1-like esterase
MKRFALYAFWLVLSVQMAQASEAHLPGGGPLRIVTLGDSITRGVRPGVKPEETYAALVQTQLRAQGIMAEVTNVGLGGERTDGALARLEARVIAQQPHLVTVMYGTNDSYVDPQQTASRLSREAYAANLRQIVRPLRARDIAVVLMTEPRWAEGSRPNGIGEDPNHRLEAYMVACRDVAKELETPLVDHFAHWSAMAQRGTKLMDWTTDGCHPNPRGHAELAHRIVQVLLPIAQRLADQHQAWDTGTPFRVQLDTVSRGYDGQMCWVHPRAGAVPGSPPAVVLTMQKLLLTGSDVFFALNETRTDDLGQTWTTPVEHQETLGRRSEPDGIIVGACDFWPKWHARTGKLLGIGHTVRYRGDKLAERRRRETCYSVYDQRARSWSPWTTLAMPDDPKFANAGAGCVQRVDLENGDILLPIYFKGLDEPYYRVTVLRCAFDGQSLRFVEQGNELHVDAERGPGEPSLARFHGRYYLTLRQDKAGYVCVSDDGLHFSEPTKWTWDDGSELGSYNTQQHWVTHSDALYLVYTRRGANNDHVIRHRAPLFIAEVDVDRLCVKRATERILVPERGARLGNFGVCDVSEHETWVTVAEWMQTWPPNIVIQPDNPYGADNTVYAARIRWTKPNTEWNRH